MSSSSARSRALLLRITYVRCALVPVVMALVLAGGRGSFAAATALFLAAAFTDFLDGYLARRWSVTTALGSFLDTTADKLLVSGTLIALVAADRASAWVAAIIIGRELVILGLRGLVASDGTVMEPSIWGKLKANVQFVAIVLALLRFPLSLGPLYVHEWAMLAAAAITLASAWDYLARWGGVLTSSGRPR